MSEIKIEIFEKFKKIRDMYEILMPDILKQYPHTGANFYPFFDEMSPIEKYLWYDIKDYGLPMYPQFPIGNYFVDFGDPVKKIAIEADGFQYHKDFEKDKARQDYLESKGWSVYRIKGREIADPEVSEEFIKNIKLDKYTDDI